MAKYPPAQWVSPKGEIHKVVRHVDYIHDNLKDFGMTEKDYQDLYAKYGEKTGTEGKARAEMITNALKKGWMRVREVGNYGFSIEIWELDSYAKDMLFDWAVKMFDMKVGKYTQANIHILQLEQAGRPKPQWLIETTMEKLLSGEVFERKRVQKLARFDDFVNEHTISDEGYIDDDIE